MSPIEVSAMSTNLMGDTFTVCKKFFKGYRGTSL